MWSYCVQTIFETASSGSDTDNENIVRTSPNSVLNIHDWNENHQTGDLGNIGEFSFRKVACSMYDAL
jgi:hypothetical protein